MNSCKGLVSAVIVTFSNRQGLRECLCSLSAQSYPYLEVIVVNNSKESLPDDFVQGLTLRVINNENNCFYARAQNQGIKISQGKFILCLNDDVILEKDFVENLVKAFEGDDKIAMACGKVLSSHDKETIDSAGLFLGKNRKPVDRGYRCLDVGIFDQQGYVFGVPGAAGMYKKSMLDAVAVNGDYFDSEYKMFYEDLDLCWRAQNKGWKGYYMPEAVAYHARGESAKTYSCKISFFNKYEFTRLGPELQLCVIKNRYSTIIKNDTFLNYLKNFVFMLGYELKLWGYVILTRPYLLFRLLKDISWVASSFKKRKIIFAPLDKMK